MYMKLPYSRGDRLCFVDTEHAVRQFHHANNQKFTSPFLQLTEYLKALKNFRGTVVHTKLADYGSAHDRLP